MTATNKLPKIKVSWVAEIDSAELTLRLLEAMLEKTRPEGATAREFLDCLAPDCVAGGRRAAGAAVIYIQECVKAAKRVN